MKRRTPIIAISAAALAMALPLTTRPEEAPPQRPKRLVRFRLENVDGKLVVTPMRRLTHYLEGEDGWRAVELKPVDEGEFIGPHEAE